jgi:DNA repair protein RadD
MNNVVQGWGKYMKLLTVKEAAEYLGVSTATIRRWERAGHLKAVRHPANDYRLFRVEDLNPFLAEAMTQGGAIQTRKFFKDVRADIDENMNLREPQREAHRAVRQHFEKSDEHALVQIPVGCGKTGVIATLPFGVAESRVLVIAPNLTIRNGVSRALDIANPNCFLTKTRTLKTFEHGPYCAVLDGVDANVADCEASQYVVTNIQQLAGSANRWLPSFPHDFFDLILVDEGHHNVAESWRKVFEHFSAAKVVSLTATPFRSDGKKPEGKIVYRYPFYRAMQNGYIKTIDSVSVAPSEISFTFKDDEYRHSLEEVLDLREEQWFRRGVALAPECNRHIAEACVARMNKMRSRTGIQHQIIAAACSVDHAKQVRSIFEELGVRAKEIHSKQPEEERRFLLEDLQQGRLDCVVQVQMLGEGFDHPSLSIAGIFRPFRSVSAYVQFVGRIMRVIHEGEPGHHDNHGYVVSHVGLNNESKWDDFKELDFEDRALLEKWLRESTLDETEDEPGDGGARRFDQGMMVQNEIISSFIHDAFLDPDDDRLLDRILATPIPGSPFRIGNLIRKEELKKKLQDEMADRKMDPQAMPVQPQRKRKAIRVRLRERTNAVAHRVLKQLGLSRAGWNLKARVKGVAGNNITIVTALLNRAVNAKLGVGKAERDKVAAPKLQEVYDTLDDIADGLLRELKGKMGR